MKKILLTSLVVVCSISLVSAQTSKTVKQPEVNNTAKSPVNSVHDQKIIALKKASAKMQKANATTMSKAPAIVPAKND